jgi:hypothetical protein
VHLPRTATPCCPYSFGQKADVNGHAKRVGAEQIESEWGARLDRYACSDQPKARMSSFWVQILNASTSSILGRKKYRTSEQSPSHWAITIQRQESRVFFSTSSPLARNLDDLLISFSLNIPRNKRCVNVPPHINYLWTRNYSTMPMILKSVTSREFGAKSLCVQGRHSKGA